MDKLIKTIIIIILFTSCNSEEQSIKNEFFEEFSSQGHLDEYWIDASQNNSPSSYHIENGSLKITTRPNTQDRVKIKTRKNDFSLGNYIWNVYVPKFDLNDQCSIGCFLYYDDTHEIDFEIGSGTIQKRNELSAQENQMIVYCTSQGFPFQSNQFLIETETWHLFKIELSLTNNQYLIKWYIDDNLVQTLQTNYNTEFKFGIYNSLENLNFIGNQLPQHENYTLFDYFYYTE